MRKIKKNGTGTSQLKETAQYFGQWIKLLEDDKEYREMHIRNMFRVMDSKLGNLDAENSKVKQIKAIGNAILDGNPVLNEELAKYRKSLLYFLKG